MIDFLNSIDLSIFYFFNHTLSAGFLDKFFSTITNVGNWYIVYAVLWGISFFKGGIKGKIAAILVIILIMFSDQTGYHFLKEMIQRTRPCKMLTDAITPLGCTGSYSFPSNHALNNFAAATFYSRLYPDLRWVLFITATLISISRVYLGLHYPSDILGGAAIGIIFGYIFSILAIYLNDRITMRTTKTNN
jgi:undecaprenyl-diphosphatase